jgi:CRISPR-associated protein Cst2
MKNKGLTITMVIEAESANYGEGYSNIANLKKVTRGDGNSYTYISRQALRYNIVEQLEWNNTPVKASGTGSKKVIQFAPEATIKDYPEIDLFGYMKTKEKKDDEKSATTRNAVVRLSNAIALEEFNADYDYLTNMGLAKRADESNAIVQNEIQKSYYAYTMTIDLDKVGIDEDIEIPEEEKKQRIEALLRAVQYLYRDIRGRRENLAPVFAIGGIYDRKNPYFENRIQLRKNKLNIEKLEEIIESDQDSKNNTKVGYLGNSFSNDAEVKEKLNAMKMNEFFDSMIKEIKEEC